MAGSSRPWWPCALLAFTIAHVSILASPWNPYIGLVPFFLVVLAAWSLTQGDRVALPLLLAGAAVATQSHLSFAIPIGLVSAWGIGFLLWQWRKPEARRGWRTSLLVSAAVVVVTWTPVLIQQVTNSPGNLSEILTYSRSAGRDPLGASLAVKLGATSFLPWGSLSMPESQAFTTKGSPLLLLVPLAALGDDPDHRSPAPPSRPRALGRHPGQRSSSRESPRSPRWTGRPTSISTPGSGSPL